MIYTNGGMLEGADRDAGEFGRTPKVTNAAAYTSCRVAITGSVQTVFFAGGHAQGER